MTLPTTIIFPTKVNFRDLKDISRYSQDMTFQLQRSYEDIAQAVNGDFRSSFFEPDFNWTPLLVGTTTPGTFTYTRQVGWTLRQGIMVDAWFDMIWTASGGTTGNLFIMLPYQVAMTDGIPFSSSLQTSTIAYGAGKTLLSINAISETFRGEIWSSGSGVATNNVAVAASGQLIGHIRYIGNENEGMIPER